MERKIFKKVIMIFLSLALIYWLPLGIVILIGRQNIATTIDELPDSDIVIIFGTIVNDSGEISPLLKERLEAGKAIMEAGKSSKIVVSNTEGAANVMATYLYNKQIPSDLVEIDTHADKTPDTCKYEKERHPENRKLIFTSQGFHLPRLLYQCNQLGVKGIAFPSEMLNTIDRLEYSFLTKFKVRTIRYIREAGLTWLAFLNLY